MAKTSGRRDRLKAAGGILGALISLSLIATTFVELHPLSAGARWSWRVDPGGFLHAIPAQRSWFVPFLLLAALQLPARAFQWQATLRRAVPFARRYRWVAIGALVHNALPGKLGDLTRAWLLGREEAIPFVESLGSVAVCKLLEFIALLGLAAATLLSPQVPQVLRGGLRVAAVGGAGLCLGVLVLAKLSSGLAARLEGRGGWPRLSRFFRDADAGLLTLRRPSAWGGALLRSSLPVLAAVLGYGLALHAMGVPNGWIGGPLVLLAISLGQSVLVVPAGAGLYFVATSWAAGALGATSEQAALLAALTQVALLLAQCGLGAIALWTSGLSLTGLTVARRDAALAQTPAAAPER